MSLEQQAQMEPPGMELPGIETYDGKTLISHWKTAGADQKKVFEKEMKRRSLEFPTHRELLFYSLYKADQSVTVFFLDGSVAFNRYGLSIQIQKLLLSRFELYELESSLNEVVNKGKGRHDRLKAKITPEASKKNAQSELEKIDFHTADIAFFE